jgi:hypothetical protein
MQNISELVIKKLNKLIKFANLKYIVSQKDPYEIN